LFVIIGAIPNDALELHFTYLLLGTLVIAVAGTLIYLFININAVRLNHGEIIKMDIGIVLKVKI
jgi:hypothetical protein